MSELGVSEVLARAEKELENLRRKISEGKDLKRDEAVLALVSALVPYIGRGFAEVSSGVETLRGDVKGLSSSVDRLLAEYSRKGEEQLQAMKNLADEFSREGQRAIASLEERLRQLKKYEEELYNTARRIQDLETREGQVKKLLEESVSLRRLLESSEEALKRRLDFSQHLSAVKSRPVTDRNPHICQLPILLEKIAEPAHCRY